jgi:MoaA/NifB/PqqE/SkfB family radical SAM enzyme
MIDSWTRDNLKHLHIELSNYCNAACLVCPRYYATTKEVDPSLKLKMMSLEDFENYFPPTIIENLKGITFCGTHGDPATCKDLVEIIEYICKNNPKINLNLHTNGGIRTTDVWSKLGELSKKFSLNIIFSFDGLKDTNHLYRRNVVWDKAMENALAFINSGGQASWSFLKFKHNIHQIEEAEKLSKQLGFIEFVLKKPYGFRQGELASPYIPAHDKDGNFEYAIFQAEEPEPIDDVNIPELEKKVDREYFLTFPQFKLNIELLEDQFREIANDNITCNMLRQDSELYINANGRVMPCCYIGGASSTTPKSDIEKQMRDILYPHQDKMDLNKLSLNEILDSNVLNDVLVSKWKLNTFTEGKPVICTQVCGKKQTWNTVISRT